MSVQEEIAALKRIASFHAPDKIEVSQKGKYLFIFCWNVQGGTYWYLTEDYRYANITGIAGETFAVRRVLVSHDYLIKPMQGPSISNRPEISNLMYAITIREVGRLANAGISMSEFRPLTILRFENEGNIYDE